jgi:hypothetical protein
MQYACVLPAGIAYKHWKLHDMCLDVAKELWVGQEFIWFGDTGRL